MPTQLNHELESDTDLAVRVCRYDSVLTEMLPSPARAYWELRRDEQERPVITLGLSSPFGYATADFSPNELEDPNDLRHHLDTLVNELRHSARRQRIEIQDKYVTAAEIEEFSHRLQSIPNIAEKRLKLNNRIQMLPIQSERMLIADFAVEVDGDVSEEVKQVIRDSGFTLRNNPLLDRHGVKDQVRVLVQSHLHDDQPTPRYAICFDVGDPVDIHLLEISDDAPDVPGAELEGIGFSAGDCVPGARSIVLYLVTPEGLRRAILRHPMHPAIRSLIQRACWFVHPDDGGIAFYAEFPEVWGA